MTIDEIIDAFSNASGYFPTAAMQAAIEQQEAITACFLERLQIVVDKGENITREDNVNWVLFALFLLAQFREKRAYPVIAKMALASSDTADLLIGDASTEGLNRIFASVYDGDLTPLQSVIENDDADEFVRSAAIRSFAPLYQAKLLDRDTIHQYCTELFRGKLARNYNHAWNSLVSCCEMFGFTDLLDDIRQAYEDGLADDGFQTFGCVEKGILNSNGQVDFTIHESDTNLIDSATEELECWAAFQPERDYSKPFQPSFDPVSKGVSDTFTPSNGEPIIRELPKIGRNDPCPCGSGKKHKKCCGRR